MIVRIIALEAIVTEYNEDQMWRNCKWTSFLGKLIIRKDKIINKIYAVDVVYMRWIVNIKRSLHDMLW